MLLLQAYCTGKHRKADDGGKTGQDMVTALRIIDGPEGPDIVFVENTSGGLAEDEDSIGEQWRNSIDARNFSTSKRMIDSSNLGGPEKRRRHYECDIRQDAPGIGRV